MKLISTPLTVEAMHRLDIDESLPGDVEELYLANEDYSLLSNCGVFDTINLALGKMIDEYEDENIQGFADLNTSLNILGATFHNTQLEVVREIMRLNQLAIKNNTGLFFYF
ncbi:hypothetical protein [Pseudomonas carnis]|uniref:hypothetical protein n=1 Tax=Pseudomonas TaxID=286 RepID=UPI000FDC4F58|nr:hypothetical protein [Pseudomonas carnis]MBJ2209756.1 hypothetical protein [Pseudomonas carnis]